MHQQLRTVHSLEPGLPVLVGRLVVRRRTSGPARDRPYLEISAWCPWCRHEHGVEVRAPAAGRDAVHEADLPCARACHVALDPANRAADRRTIDEAKAAERRWAAQALLADGRPVDRLAIMERLRGAG